MSEKMSPLDEMLAQLDNLSALNFSPKPVKDPAAVAAAIAAVVAAVAPPAAPVATPVAATPPVVTPPVVPVPALPVLFDPSVAFAPVATPVATPAPVAAPVAAVVAPAEEKVVVTGMTEKLLRRVAELDDAVHRTEAEVRALREMVGGLMAGMTRVDGNVQLLCDISRRRAAVREGIRVDHAEVPAAAKPFLGAIPAMPAVTDYDQVCRGVEQTLGLPQGVVRMSFGPEGPVANLKFPSKPADEIRQWLVGNGWQYVGGEWSFRFGS